MCAVALNYCWISWFVYKVAFAGFIYINKISHKYTQIKNLCSKAFVSKCNLRAICKILMVAERRNMPVHICNNVGVMNCVLKAVMI